MHPMSKIIGFPPIARADARVLILGSMPGKASLDAGEYYAHPRNGFWPIMEALFGIPRQRPYAERSAGLKANKAALWDVLEACVRESSLDSDILEESMAPNAFEGFFEAHPRIEGVFFNGVKAEQAFRRHVLPSLAGLEGRVRLVRLPSTSPAHARLSLDAKIAAWRDSIIGSVYQQEIKPFDPG